MSSDAEPSPDFAEEVTPQSCAACGASLALGAVLCVACGYHQKLDYRLATVVERDAQQPPDNNPYASPMAPVIEDLLPAGERPTFDLTEDGACRAKAVVADADSVYLAIVLVWCCCAPGWLVMLPWYAYRFISWHRLNAEFAELRYPNSFSPHGELAVRFQGAWFKLLVGLIAGSLFWVFAPIALAFQYLASDILFL